jgi:hypothetical protein
MYNKGHQEGLSDNWENTPAVPFLGRTTIMMIRRSIPRPGFRLACAALAASACVFAQPDPVLQTASIAQAGAAVSSVGGIRGLGVGSPNGFTVQNPPPDVSGAVHQDVSRRLGDMPSAPRVTGNDHELQLRLVPRGQTLHHNDPVVQSSASAFVATTTGLNIAGVGTGNYGFVPNAAPPDTNGAVGATQYVQWVNESFAVFDKSTGAIASGFPKSGNTLWSGFGGGCETNNDGDPIVQYDKAANRWVLTQFSVSTTPYLQCVAVSTTSDATGTYNRYSFSQPYFNDYPKLGVWPDGYYISFNMFSGNSFVGGRACAFNRTAMLAGQAATQICFQLTSTYGGLLPSDLDGSTPPPAGSPNFYVAFGNDSVSLDLWKFHVDFTTPPNSTFTHTNFPAPAFSAACGGGTCIPQLGTSQQLDSLADRLMHRLAYRNFGDHESLVVNHSVTAGSSVGVRWYEIRSPNGTPLVYQAGTYAPDSNYRWMGSIAMDGAGNIALGYSVSSSSMYPAIRYTGRAPTDQLGTLQMETSIREGGGAQSGSRLSRWGDYSAMTIDPADDCTFFYTNEYLKSTGSFNWSTQIASFKFPGCGSTVPDVAITQVSVPSPVVVSSTNNVVVTVKNIGGAAAGSFSVSLVDSLAAPISGAQVVSSLAAGASTNLTFTWTPTATGTHTLTATATSPSGETNTANNTLAAGSTVTLPPVPDVAITQVSVPSPVVVNSTNNVVVTVKNIGGAAAGNFSVSLGDRLAATISAAQPVSNLAAGASTNLTFTWKPTATGSHILTATATRPSGETNTANNVLSANSTVNNVTPPDFTLSVSPGSVNIKSGKSASYTVTITPSNGFTGPVALSLTGQPSGSNGTFTPNPATTTSTLKVTTSSSGPTGTFTLTVTGTSGALTHTATARLTTR